MQLAHQAHRQRQPCRTHAPLPVQVGTATIKPNPFKCSPPTSCPSPCRRCSHHPRNQLRKVKLWEAKRVRQLGPIASEQQGWLSKPRDTRGSPGTTRQCLTTRVNPDTPKATSYRNTGRVRHPEAGHGPSHIPLQQMCKADTSFGGTSPPTACPSCRHLSINPRRDCGGRPS